MLAPDDHTNCQLLVSVTVYRPDGQGKLLAHSLVSGREAPGLNTPATKHRFNY